MSARTIRVMLAAMALAAGCGRESEASAAAQSHVDGKNFKLDTNGQGDCKAGASCVVVLRLEAVGDYHINKEYPYKFKAEGSGVEFEGTDAAGKNVFSKGAGDFTIEGEKVATMRVKFKPAAKGNVTITGMYKLSVCSAQNCQLESQEVSVSVVAK